MFVDFAGVIVVKAHLHLERSRISRITLLALVDRILGIVLAKLVIHEFQTEPPVVVGNRRDVREHLIETLFQEPAIRVLLYFNQVRHLKDVFLLGETHADVLTDIYRMNPVFIH